MVEPDFQGLIAKGCLALATLLGGTGLAQAPIVNLPKPDSAGWIRLFRGGNTSDFYTYMGTSRQVPALNKGPFPNNVFTVVAGDTIQSAGAPLGHLIFRQPFSHYRLRFQLRWPGSIGNTGLLNKVQENDTAQSQGFPRSVECQGDPNQGLGQIWSLGSIRENGNVVNGGTWITVRAKSIVHPHNSSRTARQFDPAAPEIDYGGVGDPSDNLIVGRPGWGQPKPAALGNGGWITIEVESHGHDTTRHFVDGQLVMQYRNPRIASRGDADQVQKLLTSGLFAWQSEGSRVWFRDFRIMLFPEDPLHGYLYASAIRDARIAPKHPAPSLVRFRGPTPAVLIEGRGFLTLTGRWDRPLEYRANR